MLRPLHLVSIMLMFSLAACAGQTRVDPRMAAASAAPYTLDSGDQLRVVVFGQQNLTNSYAVDAGGHISMPLIGAIAARGQTTREMESSIAAALRNGYLREPSVSVQIEAYRPFFILGEVGSPGQYPYVNGMTAKTAVAIGGGFSPRAVTRSVKISRRVDGKLVESTIPIDYPIKPGDTVHVTERWF